MKRLRSALLLVALVVGIAFAVRYASKPGPVVLTGVVTTQSVIVSSQIAGQVDRLLVGEGDTVSRDQLLAAIEPDELKADQAYYAHSAEGVAVQVAESEAALRYQEQQTTQQIQQAAALLAAAQAQRAEAIADYQNARQESERVQALAKTGAISQQEVDRQQTTLETSRAKLEAAERQLEAQRAALALARSNVQQVAIRRSAVAASEHERAAAAAQAQKASVRVGYTEIRSPLAGVVDVRAVREGEVVATGAPLLTIVDPDDLWVRADVEESYIGRIRLGDTMHVRLPWGEERTGTVFHRGIDADFATQRDVSRTKRDIKTFEVRLRVDNRDRRLAVGMTAYVLLPGP